MRETGVRCALCVLDGTAADSADSDTGSPMTLAAMHGQLAHVCHWVEHACRDIDTVDAAGLTPLHYAALNDHVDVVTYLLQHGAALQSRVVHSKDTALHLAAAHGHTAIVQCLLAAGAHIEARNATNDTPLLAAIRGGHERVAQTLIACGASPTAPWGVTIDGRTDVGTALHLATQCGHVTLVAFLLGAVALDVNQRTQRAHVAPLHLAARHGRLEVVRFLLERHRANAHVRDTRDMTPLHYVCDYSEKDEDDNDGGDSSSSEQRRVAIALLLLAAGAKVKARRLRDHATPLRCAAMRGHWTLAQALLNNGARSNATSRWLFTLLWSPRTSLALKCLARANNGTKTCGRDALNCSGSGSRRSAVEREDNGVVLLAKSADGAVSNSDSAVHSSTMGGGRAQRDSPIGESQVLAAAPLLPRGSAWRRSRPRAASIAAETPAHRGYTELHAACLDADASALTALLKRTHARGNDLEARALAAGFTPLHLAARNGWLHGVVALLQAGANVNATTRVSGATPLHLAAEHGHIAVLRQLLARGAALGARDHAGNMALDVALCSGRSRAMRHLLRHGSGRRSSSLGDSGVADASDSISLQKLAVRSRSTSVPMAMPEHELSRAFDPKRTTTLHLAAFDGALVRVRQLVQGGADVNARDADGATPVWIAALMGRLDVVAFLAEHGAELSAVTANGAPVALGAVEFGHLEVLAFVSTPTRGASSSRGSRTRLSLQDHELETRRSLRQTRAASISS